MWRALIVSDEITQFDEDLLMKKLALDLRPPSVEQQSRKVSGGDRCTSGRDQQGGASSLESFVWPPLPTTLTHKSTHYAPHPPQTTSYQAHINPNPTPPATEDLWNAQHQACKREIRDEPASPHHCAPWHSNRHLLQKDSTTSLPCWLTLKWRLPINGCDL